MTHCKRNAAADSDLNGPNVPTQQRLSQCFRVAASVREPNGFKKHDGRAHSGQKSMPTAAPTHPTPGRLHQEKPVCSGATSFDAADRPHKDAGTASRARQTIARQHPAGAGKCCPRHSARPAGVRRGHDSANSSRSRTPAGERSRKRRRTADTSKPVPDARLSGRGWHERWPPPVSGAEAPPAAI